MNRASFGIHCCKNEKSDFQNKRTSILVVGKGTGTAKGNKGRSQVEVRVCNVRLRVPIRIRVRLANFTNWSVRHETTTSQEYGVRSRVLGKSYAMENARRVTRYEVINCSWLIGWRRWSCWKMIYSGAVAGRISYARCCNQSPCIGASSRAVPQQQQQQRIFTFPQYFQSLEILGAIYLPTDLLRVFACVCFPITIVTFDVIIVIVING